MSENKSAEVTVSSTEITDSPSSMQENIQGQSVIVDDEPYNLTCRTGRTTLIHPLPPMIAIFNSPTYDHDLDDGKTPRVIETQRHTHVSIPPSLLHRFPGTGQPPNSVSWLPGKCLDWGRSFHADFNDAITRSNNHMAYAIETSSLRPASHSNIISSATNNDLVAYVPLHLAALNGDWITARNFLMSNPDAVRAKITKGSETALHIAAGAKHTTFVEELVKWMTEDDLELKNDVENTALHFAAVSGIKRIAEVMVNKNPWLPQIRGSKDSTPLHMATLLGHREMVWYLYDQTDSILKESERVRLLITAITADLYDVALHIIERHPELAFARDDENGESALHVMARKPSAYCSETQLAFWQRCLFSVLGIKSFFNDGSIMHMQATKLVEQLWKEVLSLENDSKISAFIRAPSRLLFTAAELGNVNFLIILIRTYPNLIWKVDDQNRSIFHIAVLHRQEKVFNLIYELGGLKDLIAAYKDQTNNTILHLAAKLAPANRLKIDTGAALQLRRELHWFKEVEKIVQPLYREMRNSDGKTPQVLFSEEHKQLLREGEKWMKNTASSCMVVATLIATVMFAVFSTVPGGYNNDTGLPIFLTSKGFIVFAISDAVSLISSATSILSFLSILTSRYAEGDFLHSLPKRLIVGFATLFISIATMMITFVATLAIVLGHGFLGIKVPIAFVAGIPVSFYALLQFPLLADMISHAYLSRLCFHSCKHLMQ